jgi:hypothetical protein
VPGVAGVTWIGSELIVTDTEKAFERERASGVRLEKWCPFGEVVSVWRSGVRLEKWCPFGEVVSSD